MDKSISKINPLRRRVDAISPDVLIGELKRVAKLLDGRRFSRREFDSHAKTCKGSTIIAHFGTWAAALKAIGSPLKPFKASRKQISDQQLLVELMRVWTVLGHRPSKLEWESSDAVYSYTTYKQRFGGWIKACKTLAGKEIQKPKVPIPKKSLTKSAISKNRNIPLKLRLQIFTRDKFRCVLCGRSPATAPGSILHVDHIVPFSKGGETTRLNLRTLCEKCNWGKGSHMKGWEHR